MAKRTQFSPAMFGVPPTKTVAAAAAKGEPARKSFSTSQLADALGLGRSRRKVLRSAKGKLLRAWGGKWTADDVGQLFRSSSEFADRFVAMLAMSENITESRFPVMYKLFFGKQRERKNATLHQIRSAWVADEVAQNRLKGAAESAQGLAAEIAAVSNEGEIHPDDLVRTLFGAAANFETRLEGVRGDIATAAANTLQEPKNLLTIVRTLKRTARGVSASKNVLFQSAARMLGALDTWAGFYRSGALHAWRREGSSQVVGAEIVKVQYIVPTKFDNDGKPDLSRGVKYIAHEFSAARADTLAQGNVEILAGLLKLSPVGRCFICSTVKPNGRIMGGMFLGTDRSASRKLFLTRQYSPEDAVLHNRAPDKPLTGFVV